VIAPERTKMTAIDPNENTAFFLMEGLLSALCLNNLKLKAI
jgi:hypothetical protein